jgi:NAD(P)H-dependent FMN reductase
MAAPKILAFAGSTRRDSFNRKVLPIAVAGAREAGAEVTVIELSDYELPLFNQDLEASNPPANQAKLKQLFLDHQGLLIASPAFKGKAAGLISASPGALGGLRGLVHLRSLLGNIDVLVIPTQTSVPQAMNAFADDGSLKDPKQQASVKLVGQKLAELLLKLHR